MLIALIIGCHLFDDGLIENTCEDTPLGCAGLAGDDTGDTGSNVGSDVDADNDGLTADVDCDDADPDVGAPVDRYVDADGDGYGDALTQACPDASGYADVDGDCDDGAPEANPGESEICGDGLDNDCDGTLNGCGLSGELYANEADLIISGAHKDAQAGQVVEIIGDTNGDGVQEFALGSPYGKNASGGYTGSFSLIPGDVASSSAAESAQATIEGASDSDNLGAAILGPGDVNGDGFDDLFVSAVYESYAASYGGAVHLFYGPVTGDLDSSRSDVALYGEVSYGYAGAALAAGDLDDDGAVEVVVSGTSGSTPALFVGFSELSEGSRYNIELAPVKIYLESSANESLSMGVGDLNGDGLADLAVGLPYAGASGASNGGAYVLFGPLDSDQEVEGADVQLEGGSSSSYFGYQVLAESDIDGDGYADLVVGSPGFSPSAGMNYSGATYVFFGPLDSSDSLLSAGARVSGEVEYAYTGVSLAAGSLDGTEGSALVIGGPSFTTAGGYSGAAYVMDAPLGSIDTSEALFVMIGEEDYDNFSQSLAVGRIDGDDVDDLLIGAPYADLDNNSYSGGAWVMFGQGW